ncbi:hypothetical protein VTJ83DRAFT_4593 [Remersonia thermophila]|uniref:DNA-directed RNA polymerase III subunit rpc5 n=1 Tax=Remersonia thermophila TaxID=72144 RepID=A0ABR4DAE6_9PEZI
MSHTNPPSGAPASANDDDDPIVASYSVFLKPPLPEHRKLVVFQFVTKTAQDPTQLRVPRITELRVKPSSGMYEVDVPIDTSEAYDRAKGLAWGTALHKSMETKKDGSLGLAGGFNIVATPGGAGGGGGRGRRAAAAADDDDTPQTWAEAARQDKVLRTQTFGGVRSAQEKHTKHMIGVFQGKNLHLTPVSSVVHLRPVPHHIDAATEQDRLSRGASATGASGGAAGADKAGGAAARAIHMTIKSAMDGDNDGVATETIVDRLRRVQTESWRRMEWVHDEAEMAWEAYNECLLLRPNQHGNAAGADRDAAEEDGGDGEDKGKGKEKESAAEESSAADLIEKVVHLKTDWGEQELLQAISGVKLASDARPRGEAKVKVEEPSGAQQRAPGQSTAKRAPRKGASRSTAMEID